MFRLPCMILCCFTLLTAAVVTNGQTQKPPAPQQKPAVEMVRAIAPPRQPLPPEEASVNVTRFSFIVYGDTRGRRDGQAIQYEHSLIVDAMLGTIKKLEKTAYPVRFILQSGDAVVNGRDPKQWNASFVDLINRLTTEGGVPYFLAPGNHDVSSADELEAPERKEGLRNYLAAISQLIPPDGAPRRLAGYPTFAFGYGNTFVLAFDSNIAADDKQYDWVKSQLENLDRRRYMNVIAFCHHPPFSSGPHGGTKVEPPTAVLRSRYLPLFRAHRVKALFTGHEHFFEHWVERYADSTGRQYRMEQVVTGGGGAPLYWYQGEPDLKDYLKENEAGKVKLEHLVKPGVDPGDNAYHYVVMQVDGERLKMEVIGVDWGRNFRPYRSNKTDLNDSAVWQ